jgi:putative salt-induced outer membrane protein YdiY
MTHSNRLFPLRLAAALLLLAPGVIAADQLVMKNGDVITGQIKRVTWNKATIKPDYTGAIEVKLSQVRSISTDAPVEVELSDGRELTGQFSGLEGDSLLLVDDGETWPLERSQIRRAAPPKKYYERVSRADASLSFNNGNTDSRRATFNLDTRLRLGEHRHYTKATVHRDHQNGVARKKQNLFRYQYDWIVRKPWYLGFSADSERDPIRDLGHRTTAGAMLGRDILNDPGRFLTVKLGLGYSDESLGGVSEQGLVGLWELFFEYELGKLELLHDHGINYQHYGNNNLVFKSNTALNVDLFKNLYASFSYRYDYETEPAPNRSGTDSTFTVGVGAKF